MLNEHNIDEINVLKEPPVSKKYKANFKGWPKVEKPFVLQYVVSLDGVYDTDNDRQTGEGFSAFVDLVNKNKSQLSELKIILTDYLQRWYYGIDRVPDLSEQWKKRNAIALNHLRIPFEICSWKSYLDAPDYPLALTSIKQLYAEDTTFKAMVDEEANKHKYKAVICEEKELKMDSTKEYLFEEGAFVLLLNGYLTYPGNLNRPIQYILSKITKIGTEFYLSPAKLKFFRHTIERRNMEQPIDDPHHRIFNSCLHMSQLLKEQGITRAETQIKFFSDFISMLDSYSNMDKEG